MVYDIICCKKDLKYRKYRPNQEGPTVKQRKYWEIDPNLYITTNQITL